MRYHRQPIQNSTSNITQTTIQHGTNLYGTNNRHGTNQQHGTNIHHGTNQMTLSPLNKMADTATHGTATTSTSANYVLREKEWDGGTSSREGALLWRCVCVSVYLNTFVCMCMCVCVCVYTARWSVPVTGHTDRPHHRNATWHYLPTPSAR